MRKSMFTIQGKVALNPGHIVRIGPPEAVYTNRAYMIRAKDTDPEDWMFYYPQASFRVYTESNTEGIPFSYDIRDFGILLDRYASMLDGLHRDFSSLCSGHRTKWKPWLKHILRWKALALANRPELDMVFADLASLTAEQCRLYCERLEAWRDMRQREAEEAQKAKIIEQNGNSSAK